MEAPVCRVDVASGQVTRLTGDGHAGNVVPLRRRRRALHARTASWRPTICSASTPRGTVDAADQRQPRPARRSSTRSAFEKFSFKGANGDKVWGMKLKPAGARRAKLPIAFVVHGGPQGSFGNGWSYRWNPRLFSAPGYAVVSVDFHGSTGYGQAFTDAIRNDWGGKPLEDLQARPRLRHRAATRSSTPTTPARSAPPTAAT